MNGQTGRGRPTAGYLPSGSGSGGGADCCADWDVAVMRVYAVDAANGNDANAGFADPVDNTAGAYAAAVVAAGAVAKATVAGLAAIFPRVGRGRMVEVIFGDGTYTGSPADFLDGTSGYLSPCPIIRGTGTQATAGATAFTGTAVDATFVGGVNAVGMFGNGYTPAGAISTSNIQCTRVGGAAPAWGAEPARPLGLRIRFRVTTTTVALRNVCRQVSQTSGTDKVLLQTVEPALPVAGDVFQVETPGVTFAGACDLNAPDTTGATFVGIGFGALSIATGRWAFAFCTGTEWTSTTPDQITVAQSYTHPVLGALTVGGGFRLVNATAVVLSRGKLALAGLVTEQATTIQGADTTGTWGVGCAARNLNILNWQANGSLTSTEPPNVGVLDSLSIGIPHTFGGLTAGMLLEGSDLCVGQMNCIGAAGTPAVKFRGANRVVSNGIVGGSSGNGDVGADFQEAVATELVMTNAKLWTVTGSSSDVRTSGQALFPWTNINYQEIYDIAGNRLTLNTTDGPYSHQIDPSVILAVNASGGPITSFVLVQETGGASLQFKPAKASTITAITRLIGVICSDSSNGEAGLVGGTGYRILRFNSAPTIGATAYVSDDGDGTATTTVPATAVPVGVVIGNSFPGNIALVLMNLSAQGDSGGVAGWIVGRCRVFAIDTVNGIDTNEGYADPASTSTADYAIACALAGTRAKKTFAGLASVFPRLGNGRKAEIVIANGGVNTEGAYAESLETMVGGLYGYDMIAIRGTGTNTTAGVVAFDGSAADVTYAGGITVPGLNTAGYNPTGAATTTLLPCLQVGGAAPAFPAEPAAPLGWRVRFDAATATAALRGICRMISTVATATLTPVTAFPATPGATDVFYVEQAGVSYSVSNLSNGLGGNGANITPNPLNIAGLRCTGTLSLTNAGVRLAFCGAAAQFNSAGACVITVNQSYTHPVRGLITIGGGMVAVTDSLLNHTGLSTLVAFVVVGTLTVFRAVSAISWGVGCYIGNASGFLSQNVSAAVGSTNGTAPVVGSATAQGSPRLRFLGIIASQLTVGGCTIANAGAFPAIQLTGTCVVAFSQGVCAGATGNTDVGLDLTASRGSKIILITTPTVTGTLGDIRLAGGQIITWAQAIATGIIDSAGNQIIGTAGTPPLASLKFTGTLFGGAGLVLSYCADDALALLVANAVIPIRYPISQRLFTRLRVMTLALTTNTIANMVTLYKNGVATAMTITIPAGTAAFTKFADTTHPILFADGDDFALVAANAGADVAAVTEFAAVIEHPV